jgi:hypothetical protein
METLGFVLWQDIRPSKNVVSGTGLMKMGLSTEKKCTEYKLKRVRARLTIDLFSRPGGSTPSD